MTVNYLQFTCLLNISDINMLEGKDFIIFIDDKPLTKVIGSRSEKSSRQSRYIFEFIVQFSNDIRYIKVEQM